LSGLDKPGAWNGSAKWKIGQVWQEFEKAQLPVNPGQDAHLLTPLGLRCKTFMGNIYWFVLTGIVRQKEKTGA
jgi:hypothetical protein